MASLSRDGNGTKRILFVDADGERRCIRLGNVPVKAAEAFKSRVEELVACSITNTSPGADLASWVASLPDVIHERLLRVNLVEARTKPVSRTLGELIEAFKARASVKPSTSASYAQATDALVAFYGADKPLVEITTESGDDWRKWIGTNTRGEGKRKKSRLASDNRLSPATVAKRVHVAKLIFGKAVAWGWIAGNPFKALRAGSQANPARNVYVDAKTTEAVLEACGGLQWRLVVALSRYAGLRCPSEVGTLTWSDVAWDRGALTVRAAKTEHHGGDHAVRVVPICPRLRAILADAFEAAEPGDSLIVPIAANKAANLRTTLEKIIGRAGVKPWPRLFQNLRASCETDWVQNYPAHDVARWLGHSPNVASRHYLQPRDHHFAAVVGGGAESGAPVAQIEAQQSSASPRGIASQTSIAPPTSAEKSVFSPVNPVILNTCLVGGEGLEPPTPSV